MGRVLAVGTLRRGLGGLAYSAWTYWAGVKSRVSFRSGRLNWHLLNQAGFVGYTPGSLGETSALLILLGGLYLLFMRVISWHIPVSMIASLLSLAALFHWIDADAYPGPLVHLLSGATLLGAFFIATDLVTSPVTARGQLLFGAGCGVLVFVIRTWAGYPEGMAFAVMLMNGLTPLIDHYIRPRVYGRNRKGEPLAYDSKSESP